MHLDGIMLSHINQAKTNTYMILLTCGIKQQSKHTKQNENRLIGVRINWRLPEGRSEGWEK